MLAVLPYDDLLILHLLAVAVFVSCMLLIAASLPSMTGGPADEAGRAEARRLLGFHRLLGGPALLLLWLCGAGMAMKAGWYAAGWLQAKVPIVAGLSWLYLRLVHRTRDVAAGRVVRPVRYRSLGAAAAAIAAIVILVIAKPF